MGLKTKIKHGWHRVSVLDDEGQSEKAANARIPYKNISQKLKELMKENVDVVGRRILIPNYYAIFFNEEDREKRREVEDVLCDELREELYHEMRKINPEQIKEDIIIDIESDPSIEKGSFKITFRMKKPSVAEAEEMKRDLRAGPHPSPTEGEDYKPTIIEGLLEEYSEDEIETVVHPRESIVLYSLSVDSGEDYEELAITKPIISIGRSTKDDVVLKSEDFAISRAHATIEVKSGEFYLTPIGVNGTFLNGQELALKQEVKLVPGDELKIMNYTLRIIA
jgi:hypothetical protein